MPITKGQLNNLATRFVQNIDANTGLTAIVNQAGNSLVNARRWRWLARPPVTFAFVGGQDWVPFPDDFGTIIAMTTTTRLGSRLEMSDLATIARLRNEAPHDAQVGEYSGAVAYVAGAAPARALTPRLEVFPRPASSLDPAGHLYYLAKFEELADEAADTTQISIPTFMEPLFLEVFQAVLRGWEEQDVADDLARRARVLNLNNPTFANAVSTDKRVQPDWGRLGGTTDQRIHEFVAGDVTVQA